MESISGIKKISDLQEVSNYLRNGSLLLLDIDDTLITPDTDKRFIQECPNREFREKFKGLVDRGYLKHHNNKFMSYCSRKYQWLVKRYNIQIGLIDWKLINNKSPKLIHKWQRKCTTIGFTARGYETYHTTKNTLRKLKINFGHTKLKRPMVMSNITCGRTGVGDEGVIFCGGYSKGLVLEWILEPKRLKGIKNIVFVDDSKSNLEDVQDTCKKLNINFVGLHYVRQ